MGKEQQNKIPSVSRFFQPAHIMIIEDEDIAKLEEKISFKKERLTQLREWVKNAEEAEQLVNQIKELEHDIKMHQSEIGSVIYFDGGGLQELNLINNVKLSSAFKMFKNNFKSVDQSAVVARCFESLINAVNAVHKSSVIEEHLREEEKGKQAILISSAFIIGKLIGVTEIIDDMLKEFSAQLDKVKQKRLLSNIMLDLTKKGVCKIGSANSRNLEKINDEVTVLEGNIFKLSTVKSDFNLIIENINRKIHSANEFWQEDHDFSKRYFLEEDLVKLNLLATPFFEYMANLLKDYRTISNDVLEIIAELNGLSRKFSNSVLASA